jgi:hypothetical protein
MRTIMTTFVVLPHAFQLVATTRGDRPTPPNGVAKSDFAIDIE